MVITDKDITELTNYHIKVEFKRVKHGGEASAKSIEDNPLPNKFDQA